MKRILYSLLLLAITACGRDETPQGKREVAITAFKADPVTIPAIFSFAGRTESSHLVEIRARVEGYLEKIAFREGAMVNQGDLLFLLDPKPFEVALDSANAELNQQKAILWNAEQDAERLQPLYQQKAASKKDLDAAMAQVRATKAAVEAAVAKREEAKLNLSYTQIKAPNAGLTSQSNYRVGALITPGSLGLLTTISAIDPIWVIFSVSENELLKAKKELDSHCLVYPEKMDFDVAVDLGQGERYKHLGKVDFATPSFDPTTGMQTIRAVFPNPEGELKPGQFVRVNVIGAKRPGALIVPKQSVLQGNTGFYVYVVDANGLIEAKTIEIGSWYEQFWIIKGGLESGSNVVVDGVNKIEPGSKVKVVGTVALPEGAEPYAGPACK